MKTKLIVKILIFFVIFLFGIFVFAYKAQVVSAASLNKRVNVVFRSVFYRNPSSTESLYWQERVASKDVATEASLKNKMLFYKSKKLTLGERKLTHKELLNKVDSVFREVFGKKPSSKEHNYWSDRVKYKNIVDLKNLKGAMAYHKAKGKTIGAVINYSKKSSSVSSKLNLLGEGGHPMGDQVRIGIYSTTGAMEITSSGKYQVREGEKTIRKTLAEGQIAKVTYSGGKYHVRAPGLSLDTENYIRFLPLNGAIMEIKSYKDLGASGRNYNRFRGTVEVRKADSSDKLWAINEVRIEYYLRGLSETGEAHEDKPQEYYKALGIAARTYVLYHHRRGGRFPANHFDIDNTANDQLYRGYEYEQITPRRATLFEAVKGVVVALNGDLAVTTYFSQSDGRTRSAEEVWKTKKFPHLQSAEDPYGGGKLWGHGVGLSAQGAYGYAKNENRTWQWLLKHYYKGIDILRAY